MLPYLIWWISEVDRLKRQARSYTFHPNVLVRVACPERDSNSQHRDFESRSSASWDTGAALLVCLGPPAHVQVRQEGGTTVGDLRPAGEGARSGGPLDVLLLHVSSVLTVALSAVEAHGG